MSKPKLPLRLSYYPNKIAPKGVITYVPHPKGKKHAIRKVFWYSKEGGETAAVGNAMIFSIEEGQKIWGDAWRNSGRLGHHAKRSNDSQKGVERPNKVSRVVGVRHYKREFMAQDGTISITRYWYATWYEKGKQHKKQFAYGGTTNRTFVESHNEAVEHRAKMVKLHYKMPKKRRAK